MQIIVKALIFTIFVPGFVTVAMPYLLLHSGIGLAGDIGYYRYAGIIPAALGITIYIITVYEFAAKGSGTPAPLDPPVKLVTGRLYRFTRNPMYIGVLLILAGEAILFVSPVLVIYVFFVWLLFHLFVVYYEEPKLSKKFGETYLSYMRNTPRWFLKRQQSAT